MPDIFVCSSELVSLGDPGEERRDAKRTTTNAKTALLKCWTDLKQSVLWIPIGKSTSPAISEWMICPPMPLFHSIEEHSNVVIDTDFPRTSGDSKLVNSEFPVLYRHGRKAEREISNWCNRTKGKTISHPVHPVEDRVCRNRGKVCSTDGVLMRT